MVMSFIMMMVAIIFIGMLSAIVIPWLTVRIIFQFAIGWFAGRAWLTNWIRVLTEINERDAADDEEKV